MTDSDYKVGYGKPPRHALQAGRAVGQSPGPASENLAALLLRGLNEPVVVTDNGRRRTITKREAIASQLINKSAGADWRATKMLLDAVKGAEK